ncbi:uncharacterized protein LOC119069842 [Bradysia coprophila]|uniref:uncharacterized protein LOC119069842 n=1 Tax=Bradysia coprophila TaxID=38358 RepID=UPI00187DA70C|nr:uncharacterized protein LOC119069842 [Bradysia coprophila]
MDNNLNTRLLIPLFEYLKTDPVIVNYKIFSRSCAEIIFVLSFLITNVCVMRGFFATLWNTNEVNTKFYDSMKRILKEEIDNYEDCEEDESNQLDENGNDLETADLSVDETIVTDGQNET